MGKILEQEGYELMGAAFEVYNELGFGLLEEVYQEAMEIELNERKISFKSQEGIQTYYKKQKLQKKYIPDLVVYGEIIAELKALKQLLPEHDAQLFNYMKLTGKHVGYLINFGNNTKLEWKRIIANH